MKHQDTRTFQAHLPRSLMESVTEVAKQQKISPSQVLQRAFEEWQYIEERRYRKTLEGLADGDAGRVVAHEDVKIWADQLGTDDQQPPPYA